MIVMAQGEIFGNNKVIYFVKPLSDTQLFFQQLSTYNMDTSLRFTE